MSITSLARSNFKYVYLAAFFALLSGIFHPFISDSPIELVVIGIVTLFAGLAGVILLYKAATFTQKQPEIYNDLPDSKPGQSRIRLGVCLAGGFILTAISLMYIYQLTGRI